MTLLSRPGNFKAGHFKAGHFKLGREAITTMNSNEGFYGAESAGRELITAVGFYGIPL